jgi:hypothetical protein
MLKLLAAVLIPVATASAGLIVTNAGAPCMTSLIGIVSGATGFGTYTFVSTVLADYLIPPNTPSSCTVTETDILTAGGPGAPADTTAFLRYSVRGGGEGSRGFGSGGFSINGVRIASCAFDCFPADGTLPITLGTPFEIETDAGAAFSGSQPPFFSYMTSVQATIQVIACVPGVPNCGFCGVCAD